VYRILLCLPLCFVVAPGRPDLPPAEQEPTATVVATQEPLPTKDPVTFLEKCLKRYEVEGIKGYSAVFQKQERLASKLQPSEEIQVYIREQPFSVFMHWLRGVSRADKVLYVEGENNGMMLVHPSGLAGALVKVVTKDPEGAEARQSGRYTIKTMGLKRTLERTHKDWKAAQDEGTLQVEYLGVRKVREAGDRLCYTLRRTQKPDSYGVTQITIYIDKESWLQVGTVQKDADNKLMGEYMYRDIHLNPKFKPDQFTPAAVSN
jgi:hypothetical protein